MEPDPPPRSGRCGLASAARRRDRVPASRRQARSPVAAAPEALPVGVRRLPWRWPATRRRRRRRVTAQPGRPAADGRSPVADAARVGALSFGPPTQHHIAREQALVVATLLLGDQRILRAVATAGSRYAGVAPAAGSVAAASDGRPRFHGAQSVLVVAQAVRTRRGLGLRRLRRTARAGAVRPASMMITRIPKARPARSHVWNRGAARPAAPADGR